MSRSLESPSLRDADVVTDSRGRALSLRRLTVVDRLRLFKAAGAVLAENHPWFGMAVLAASVAAIDDVPVPIPTNEAQIEAAVSRLGDEGLSAAAAALDQEDQKAIEASAGNLQGTPT
jgi:hypothetical protein